MRTIDLANLQSRLAATEGRVYWRSLDELADTDEFREMLYREFPVGACEPDDSVSRRNFLKVMGAALALAGLGTGCYRQPEEKIVPYIQQPENVVPGKPLFYATAFPFRGYGIGALAESHMGRPTKIEGNPDHPASLGATNVFMQASVLDLYDPDRAQVVTRAGDVSTWQSMLAAVMSRLDGTGGRGLRLLTGTITSPTLIAQIEALQKRYPDSRWHIHEPVGRENATEGARLAFGRPIDAIYDFEKADVVVSLESNFLLEDPGSLRYARQFIRRRRVARPNDGRPIGNVRMNRLFVAEAVPTITGAMADSRLPLRSSRIVELATAIARAGGANVGAAAATLTEDEQRWVDAVLQALGQARGTSLILAGESQPPIVHLLAHAMNAAMGNVGQTVRYIEPVAPVAEQNQTLDALAADIDAGAVDTLVILDSNPVYTAPADLRFAERLKKVPLRVAMSSHYDETAFLCHWHAPLSHWLESWSDVRAFDGLVSIIQPLIMPLYQSRSRHELLAILVGMTDRSAYDIVRDYWLIRLGRAGNERTWQESLHQGFVGGQTAQPAEVTVNANFPQAQAATQPSTEPSGSIELVFRPDPTIWDGAYANNPWLQETPKPLTKLTWDNAAHMSPATAERLKLGDGDIIGGINAAAMVVPGHADDCISLTLGYGRSRAGRVGNGCGFNAYALRRSDARWTLPVAHLTRTGKSYPLATTQRHFNLEGRDLVRTVALDEFRQPTSAPTAGEDHAARTYPLSILPHNMPHDPPYRAHHAWGMSIDLSSCIGCNACVVACVAENNIPMVGKEQVQRSREMHWIRIDTYYSAEPGVTIEHLRNPQTHFQPVACMHCETAPCELVCPVAATSHSVEGLNEMTYNRCIGTRYCSNNCPYKVRRFNFFEYNPPDGPETLKMQKNPDVTVRSRGVMEKCTYCVQRITQGRIDAEKENRRVRDGEVKTACQQACPTEAIVFGDIGDETSLVHALKFGEPFARLDYGMLNENLGTRPRTTYMAKVTPT